jgi:hypothetical protein
MAAATEAPAWRTFLIDTFGLVLVVWSIPLAILVVGAPIVLVVSLIIKMAAGMF